MKLLLLKLYFWNLNRNHDGTVNEKNRNEVSVGRVLRNGKVIGGSPSLECEKKANNVKYSG